MSKTLPPTVVVRYDDEGEVEFYVEGNVRLLIIDERAPDDRVYEVLDRCTRSDMANLIGGDESIRHKRMSSGARAARTGKPISACPYAENGKAWHDWVHGWRRARDGYAV